MEKNFLEALNKLQQDIEKIVKSEKNPYFESKYADLNSLFKEVKPKMKEQGWVLIQSVQHNVLHTELVHLETMGKLESDMDLLTAKPDMQQLGSAITYARRYSLLALLNVETVDDDANKASGKTTEFLDVIQNIVDGFKTSEELGAFYSKYKADPIIINFKKELNDIVAKKKEQLKK